ncbi:solute carrier family 35 member E4 isoform X2 [Hoplias malabaricus]|uniref:solute carrier family 35 member E4 isoform X2 n=1 Tax=Hoplias malabaricus TaxID=27720 RepID=UPI0034637A3B
MHHSDRCQDEAKMISSSSDGSPKFERRRRRRVPETFHLLTAVVVWLVTGTTISSLNKWIFAVHNFRYPLLLSALHMLTAIVVDYGLIKCWFVRRTGLDERDLTSSAKCKVFLLSLTFCASIAFGNVGLNYVQLSFAQMIYTTTPIFTLAISSLVLGKQHHILKYTAMMPICLGASFSIMGEVQFDQTGCLFVVAATMLRGVKSIQQSILLQEEKIHSVFLLYLMAIPSFCILAVAALVLENWAGLQSPLHYDRQLWGFVLLSCLGSVLYNLASCCVISLTSAVTLHILGNLNVVGNLLLSQLLFESQLSALSCAGAALTLSGLVIYQNSELIGDFLDSRRTRPASRDIKNRTPIREGEPEPGTASEWSSEPEPPLDQSLDLSSEDWCSEEPWTELCDDLEPYQDLEPSSETSLGREPSLGTSSKLTDLQLSLENSSDQERSPELCHDEVPSPEISQTLCDNLEPCPETLSKDLEPGPNLCHKLETPPGLEQSPELSQNDLEPSPELYSDLKTSTDSQLSPETSPEEPQILEPCTNISDDLEPRSEKNSDPETTSEMHQDLELSTNTYLELYNNLEQSSEISQLQQDLKPRPETSPEWNQTPEAPPELCHILEQSLKLYCDLKPSVGTSPEPYPGLEPSPEASKERYHRSETSLELHQDVEPCPDACSEQQHNLQSLMRSSPEQCSDLEAPSEPSPDDLALEPSPESTQLRQWTEESEGMD